MTEVRLSRCLNGKLQFRAKERDAISKTLRYPESWLFKRASPPSPEWWIETGTTL
jgi:hypothetical protein